MHTRSQTTQIEFAGIVKGQYLTSIVDSLTEVVNDLAELIEPTPVGFAPASSLDAIDPTHVISTLPR